MREIAPGLWQLAGFPPNVFNVYLAGDVLIDAATRFARRRISRELGDRRPALVALTHCHPDHQGVAHEICTSYGVSLACHEADCAAMEGREPMHPRSRMARLSRWLWAGPPHPVGWRLRDGDLVAGFRVVHAPGHTPGHVVFFRESDRVAVVGDLLFSVGVTVCRVLTEPPAFFSADAEQNRRSIRLLAELRPSLLCFGHGPPLRQPAMLDRFVAKWERLRVPRLAPSVSEG
jgi:glyoxylase-like metal-dependent hydrolase (beta-lactamase superfamily II)